MVFINDSIIRDDSRHSNAWFFVMERPVINFSEIRARCFKKKGLDMRRNVLKREAVHLLESKFWEVLFLEHKAPDGKEIRLS